MKRMSIFAVALAASAVPLASCATFPGSPGAVASHTVLDEKGVIGIETAYTAASRAAALAIRTGVVTDKATIARIGRLDNQAYAAVQLSRAAYQAGNATSYKAAFDQAQSAIAAILASF